jgi:bacterial/archaeal transporter family protein
MGFWMAVLAMVCWGLAPIFAKIGLNNVDPVAGLVLRTMIAASMVIVWVGVTGSLEQISTVPASSWGLIAIEAFLATVVGDLAYYAAIKKADVSLVVMVMATSPLITMICAALFLGEPITVWRVVGACYIIFGIILIGPH